MDAGNLFNGAEFVAHCVTIIGVIVVYIQFVRYKRENKIREDEELRRLKDDKSIAFQNRYELYNEMDKMLVARPYLKKLISNETLITDIESGKIDNRRLQELAFMEMVLNICQLSYFQFKNDTNDSGLNWVKELLQNKYIIEYWTSGYRCKYTDDFEQFVRSNIKL